MRLGSQGTLGGLVFAFLVGGSGACRSHEPVIPFMDAGDPCSGSDAHAIDCAEFADTKCVVPGSVCPQETYGCADAAYFTNEDYSQCPPEGGPVGPPIGDASLLGDAGNMGDDAGPEGAASEAGDAGDSSVD